MKYIAQNNGRYYVENLRQMRYFPIAKKEAVAMLAAGTAEEVIYQPFGRVDLIQANMAATEALNKIMAM